MIDGLLSLAGVAVGFALAMVAIEVRFRRRERRIDQLLAEYDARDQLSSTQGPA